MAFLTTPRWGMVATLLHMVQNSNAKGKLKKPSLWPWFLSMRPEVIFFDKMERH